MPFYNRFFNQFLHVWLFTVCVKLYTYQQVYFNIQAPPRYNVTKLYLCILYFSLCIHLIFIYFFLNFFESTFVSAF